MRRMFSEKQIEKISSEVAKEEIEASKPKYILTGYLNDGLATEFSFNCEIKETEFSEDSINFSRNVIVFSNKVYEAHLINISGVNSSITEIVVDHTPFEADSYLISVIDMENGSHIVDFEI